MKSFLVIGLGRFGRHLTRYLLELGNEVMVLDKDEEKVAKVAGMATAACVGDCQDEQVLESLGVRNFDICFVCVRDDFQCSLEATAALKELGPGRTRSGRLNSCGRSGRTMWSTRRWTWPAGPPSASPPKMSSTTLS